VGDQPRVPGGVDQEVHVGGPHRAAAPGLEQSADRAVVGDRVGLGEHGPEPEAPVLGGCEVPAAAHVVAFVLHVVEAVLVGLPKRRRKKPRKEKRSG